MTDATEGADRETIPILPGIPGDEGGRWNLTFHLQAKEDKSLLVGAEDIWKTSGTSPSFLKKRFEHPQERLLEDLGRASAIFPEIEDSLQESCPVSLSLDTTRAYEFLREAAPLLEQNGFGVMLPAWWDKPAVKMGVKLKVSSKEAGSRIGSGLFGLDSILDYSWEVALGDRTLSPGEFEALAQLKVPLVRVRGQWVELRKEDVEKAIAFFSTKHDGSRAGEMKLQQALRLAMGRENHESGMPVVEIRGEGMVGEVFDRLSGGIAMNSLPVPEDFNGQLRPYQLRGYSWLDFMSRFGLGACLADDMGLGKTIQFITLMLRKRGLADRTLGGPGSEGKTGVPGEEASVPGEEAGVPGEGASVPGEEAGVPGERGTGEGRGGTGTGGAGKEGTAVGKKGKGRKRRAKRVSDDREGAVTVGGGGTDDIRYSPAGEVSPPEHTPPVNPTLIICPMSVAANWKKELQRFAPSLKVMVHHGPNRLSGLEFADEVSRNHVVISTYATVLRDHEDFAGVHWHGMALDEAQNIKNPTAKQTRAIKGLDAGYRVALTGTPVENRLSELWSIMDFLNPGYLGPAKEFHRSFAIPIEKYRNGTRSEMLQNLIRPFVLRRLKSDPQIIDDLPSKMEMKVFCNLTQEQASLYEATVREMMGRIDDASGITRKGLVLAALTSLKQICNHPAQFVKDGSPLPGRSGKLARLTEMLEEVLSVGDRALIFTQFAEMGVMLKHHLQETFDREVLFLHGGTTKKQRDAMISRFQACMDGGETEGGETAGRDGEDNLRSGPALFILSLKAGGLGLNLTAANHVFHFDRWWNPAVEDQATDRAFRIGQRRNVHVHKFVCAGTLEERIDAMIEQKKELARNVVGTGEGWITELSTDQLRDMFELSREEVGGE